MKKLLLIYIFAILMVFADSIIGYSQPVWYKTFGSWNAGEQGRRVIQTFDGGYLALIFQGNLGPDYYYLLKLDNSGNLLWRKLLADSSNKDVYEFQQTSDSGFIFAGRCTTSPWGGLLIKTDKNGNFKWQKNYTNLSYQTQFGMVRQTFDKGFISCGFFVDLINGGAKGVAVKTDSAGNVQWEKQYIDSLMNEYADIIQDSLGNYYLTGNIYNLSSRNYVIVKKLNFIGNVIRTNVINYSDWWGSKFIFLLKNNSLIISGFTRQTANITPILAKTDTSGNVRWINNYNYQTSDFYSSKDIFDNIIFSGNYIASTFRIGKIDSSGNLIKLKSVQFSGYNFIGAQCIKPTYDLGYIISGVVNLLDSFNNPHPFSLILKTDSAFNAPIITNTNNNTVLVIKDFRLYQNYPNPFNPITKIKFDIPAKTVGQTFLSVYDILGKEIATLVNESALGGQPGTYSVDFDGTNFPSGIYFYRLTAGDFLETKKMMLIK
jgi:hypothetical protein